MRVLFDTNVVLDVLLARAPHAAAATTLFDYVARKDLDGLLGATTLTTIFYLAAKASTPAKRPSPRATRRGVLPLNTSCTTLSRVRRC